VPNNVVVADVDADVGGGVQVTVTASKGKLNAPTAL